MKIARFVYSCNIRDPKIYAKFGSRFGEHLVTISEKKTTLGDSAFKLTGPGNRSIYVKTRAFEKRSLIYHDIEIEDERDENLIYLGLRNLHLNAGFLEVI